MKSFLAQTDPNNLNLYKSPTVYGNSPNNQQYPGTEASLDLQYLTGIAPGIPTSVYSMSDKNPYNFEYEGFLEYLRVVGSQASPPLVHSISYGDTEAFAFISGNQGAITYANRVEAEFAKMGLRGLTVVVASGDSGMQGCGDIIDGRQCLKPWAVWPASSPYVTAVGATQPSPSNHNTEVVCSALLGGIITSGGGFSSVNSRSKVSFIHPSLIILLLTSYKFLCLYVHRLLGKMM